MIEEKHHQHRLELHPKSRKMRGSTYPRQVAVGSSPSQTSSTLKIRPDVLPGLSGTTAAASPDVRRNVRRNVRRDVRRERKTETYDVIRVAVSQDRQVETNHDNHGSSVDHYESADHQYLEAELGRGMI